MRRLSVIIPTHNPRPSSLSRVLAALDAQSLPRSEWELLVVDNSSTSPPDLGDDWSARLRMVREDRLGLTHARLRGIAEARGEVLVWVDDDNVLAPSYLANALAAFEARPALGAAGGKSIPEYEVAPPPWFYEGLAPLGCRDLGDEAIYMQWQHHYPAAAPIGAGLVVRRSAMLAWADEVSGNPSRLRLGRQGSRLTSGEDNDICLTVLRQGLKLAYLPNLSLTHLITASRIERDYLARIGRVSYRDFVNVLALHGVRPWRPVACWTLPLRMARAYFMFRAWRGPAEYIRWQSVLGQFEGRAQMSRTHT